MLTLRILVVGRTLMIIQVGFETHYPVEGEVRNCFELCFRWNELSDLLRIRLIQLYIYM